MTREGWELFAVITLGCFTAGAVRDVLNALGMTIAARWQERQDRLRAEAYARECENEELPF